MLQALKCQMQPLPLHYRISHQPHNVYFPPTPTVPTTEVILKEINLGKVYLDSFGGMRGTERKYFELVTDIK